MKRRHKNRPGRGPGAWTREPKSNAGVSPQLQAALTALYGDGCRPRSVAPEMEAATLSLYDASYRSPEGYAEEVFIRDY